MQTNLGTIKVEGTATNSTGFDRIIVKKFRENILTDTFAETLVYNGAIAAFGFRIPIKAEMANYKIEIYGNAGSSSMLLANADSLLAGDAFIIQGQSNAVAEMQGQSDTHNESPYIRAWGSASGSYRHNWYTGNGNNAQYEKGHVGQWGLHLANKLLNFEHIPIVVFNGANGGEPISWFEKDYPSSPNNYTLLLQRVTEAGFIKNIRAIFWYQGESDSNTGNSVQAYKDSFYVLYDDWKHDYAGFEHLYIIQTKLSCLADAEASAIVAEAHRELYHELPNTSLLATNGLRHYGPSAWCHYKYDSGYKEIGNYLFMQVERDIHNLKHQKNIESPEVVKIEQTAPNELTLYFKNIEDTYIWETGVENDFALHTQNVSITDGVVDGSAIRLTLSKSVRVDSLSFYGHLIGGSPCIRNLTGEGIAGFYKFPVTQAQTTNARASYRDELVTVSPNPVHDVISVKYVLGRSSVVTITIRDLTGKIWITKTCGFKNAQVQLEKIPVQFLPEGPYMLTVNSNGNILTAKFIKN